MRVVPTKRKKNTDKQISQRIEEWKRIAQESTSRSSSSHSPAYSTRIFSHARHRYARYSPLPHQAYCQIPWPTTSRSIPEEQCTSSRTRSDHHPLCRKIPGFSGRDKESTNESTDLRSWQWRSVPLSCCEEQAPEWFPKTAAS
jgi:hypothetical protein